MRPERARTARAPLLRGFGVSGAPPHPRPRAPATKGDTMDEKALPHFASRFQTVAAWREAMHALGYTMPLQLCHGLSQAMTHLRLTFPEAFRLLWDNQKIIVAGPSLIYACSASMLWAAGKRPPSAPPAGPTPPAVARGPDVLALVPPTEDVV